MGRGEPVLQKAQTILGEGAGILLLHRVRSFAHAQLDLTVATSRLLLVPP